MKKENVLNFANFLSNLKLNKFDKEIRGAIVKNSITANKIVKDFEENVKSARDRFVEGKEEEIKLLEKYRAIYKNASLEEQKEIVAKIMAECESALIVEQDLNNFINDLIKEDVDLKFVKIDKDCFIDQCSEADIDITPALLETLNDLFD